MQRELQLIHSGQADFLLDFPFRNVGGHGLDLVRQSQKDNVIILGYPPHCTHALQGLDVICFGLLKKAFHSDIREFERLHHRAVGKNDFAGVFGAAFLRVFQPALIKKAFEVTPSILSAAAHQSGPSHHGDICSQPTNGI